MTENEIQRIAVSKIGRRLTREELNQITGSNVRDVTQIGVAIAAFAACANPLVGIAAAVGGASLAKPVYDTVKEVPIVGEVLDVLEDIFG